MAHQAGPKSYYQLAFFWMAVITCGLPFFATTFCVLWSVAFDFEASTRTHCRVRNYLPSVSAAIGVFTPQKYVWRICIGLHSTPRFMIAFAYYNYHTSLHLGRDNELYKLLATVNTIAHVVEVGSLIGLTYISSDENHELHKLCFVFFMVGAIIYMSLTIGLLSWGRSCNGRVMTLEESSSLRWKKRLFAFNLSVFVLSLYLYCRHNWYCEPGVYSWFAMAEYLIIFSNILFHFTATLDFSWSKLVMTIGEQMMPSPQHDYRFRDSFLPL